MILLRNISRSTEANNTSFAIKRKEKAVLEIEKEEKREKNVTLE